MATLESGTGESGTGDPAPADRQVLTVPNVITFVRLLCIPLFVYILFAKDNRAGAALLLGALGATDWVDGYVARRTNSVSELGKILDPLADRLLFIVGITAIIIDGSAPLWFSILVVAREVVIGGTLAVLYLMGMERFDVTFAGKTATFLLMIAFPLFLMGSADVRIADLCWLAGWLLGIPGLILSYYTAVMYIPVMRRSLAAGRGARRAARSEHSAEEVR